MGNTAAAHVGKLVPSAGGGATTKVFDFGRINFMAENGPVANYLANAKITLVSSGIGPSRVCVANFQCNPGSNGRKGEFDCVFNLEDTSNGVGTIEFLSFGQIRIICSGSPAVQRQVSILPEYFDAADQVTFPSTSQQGVDAC